MENNITTNEEIQAMIRNNIAEATSTPSAEVTIKVNDGTIISAKAKSGC